MDQLILQGYTVKISGDKCQIYPMFNTPVFSPKNERTGLTKEDDIGEREIRIVIDEGPVHEEYKEDYLNTYFESLNMSSMELNHDVMGIRPMQFQDFSDCISLFDKLEDVEYVFNKHELEVKFEEMIECFLRQKLGINSRPVPPYAKNNRKIDLHKE
ncbi:hypothetical protein Hanom_Chr03g00265141 [Helianthus anomalus]